MGTAADDQVLPLIARPRQHPQQRRVSHTGPISIRHALAPSADPAPQPPISIRPVPVPRRWIASAHSPPTSTPTGAGPAVEEGRVPLAPDIVEFACLDKAAGATYPGRLTSQPTATAC